MEANCLLSSETIKIEPGFETKPSGPIFPAFTKQEIKPEADIEVDRESWTNAQEVYSLDRNLQDCKTEEDTRNREELLFGAKCESVQVQHEDVYSERCLELENVTVNNKAIEYVHTKHNNDMLTLHNENWSSESNDMLSMSKEQKQLQTVDKCDVYKLSFAQSETLDRHKVAHTDEKPYKCEDASFAHKHNITEHVKVHNEEMAFKHLTLFTVSSIVKEHKRVHAGKKSYKCDVCGISCAGNSHLIRHKRIHTGEKPYKCNVCEVSFAQSSNLTDHKRKHTGEKHYKCDVCEASFVDSSSLISHKRTHTGEKPYKCDMCEASFARNNNLIIHKRTHTGEKPYKCDVCEASFAQIGHLIQHKRKHTGEKPYKCDVFEISFG